MNLKYLRRNNETTDDYPIIDGRYAHSRKHVVVTVNGEPKSVSLILPLCDAALLLRETLTNEAGPASGGIKWGFGNGITSKGQPFFIAEAHYSSAGKEVHEVAAILEGIIYWVAHDENEQQYPVYEIESGAPRMLAAWIALCKAYDLSSPEFNAAFLSFLEATPGTTEASEALDILNLVASNLLDEEYPSKDIGIYELKKSEIVRKVWSPQEESVLGEFEIIPCKSFMKGTMSMTTIKMKDYSSTFEEFYNSLSDDEKMFIPAENPRHVATTEEQQICEMIAMTASDLPDLKTRFVLLEGPAGTGKSELSMTVASRFKMPFSAQTCLPGMTADDWFGTMMPISGSTKWLQSADRDLTFDILDSGNVVERVKEMLNMPSDMEIEFTPGDAYMQITGEKLTKKEAEDIVSSQCYDAMMEKVAEKVKHLYQDVNKDSSEIKYDYHPSAFIERYTKGGMLEIQEPSIIKDQGVLVTLNNALELASDGIFRTPYGVAKRHPYFYAFATTNRDYRGCKPLNQSVRSRFQMFIDLQPPASEDVAMRICEKVPGTDPEIAAEVAALYARLADHSAEVSNEITLRAMFNFTNALNHGFDYDHAYSMFVKNAISTDPDEASVLDGANQKDTLRTLIRRKRRK